MKLPLLRLSRIQNVVSDECVGVQLWLFPLKINLHFHRFEDVQTIPPTPPPFVVVMVGRFVLTVGGLPYSFRAALAS